MPTSPDIDVKKLPVTRLLSLYAEILTELMTRRVVRTRNAPAGDLAELLVARAYGGSLAPNSAKSWDVESSDGRLLQVKCRVVQTGDARSHTFSLFRSWGFDACVFLVLDANTYEVVRAVEVPVDQVRAISTRSAWVAGDRVTVNQVLVSLPGAEDVTDRIRDALSSIDNVSVAIDAGSGGAGVSAETVVLGEAADVAPTGWCFCGCGEVAAPGKFFVVTHDRKAESAIIREKYGSIAGLVVAHGHIPGPTSGSDT